MARNTAARHRIDLEWLGARQVTEYANVSRRTLRAWIHQPVDPLPAVRVAGKILVRRSALDAWLERHRVKAVASLDLNGIVKEVLGKLANGR
jgi:excisionase family DNA binding protein